MGSIIANYIKQRTKNAQFIVISLRNHMFELADLLVGIYKTQDISKSVAINPAVFEVKKLPLQESLLHSGDGSMHVPDRHVLRCACWTACSASLLHRSMLWRHVLRS